MVGAHLEAPRVGDPPMCDGWGRLGRAGRVAVCNWYCKLVYMGWVSYLVSSCRFWMVCSGSTRFATGFTGSIRFQWPRMIHKVSQDLTNFTRVPIYSVDYILFTVFMVYRYSQIFVILAGHLQVFKCFTGLHKTSDVFTGSHRFQPLVPFDDLSRIVT